MAASDTDSFFLRLWNISEEEFYLKLDRMGMLDSSIYPPEHPLYFTRNKARLGCVKNEVAGSSIKSWVFLRPRAYSLLTVDHHHTAKLKGVQRATLAEIEHQNYVNVVQPCCR